MSDQRYYLVEFAHVHVDFQVPEVASCLETFGLHSKCTVHPLPSQTFLPCKLTEFIAQTRSKGEVIKQTPHRSFIILSFTSWTENDHEEEVEEERNIISALTQCVLVRGIIELWGAAADLQACADRVKQFILETNAGTYGGKLVKKHCIENAKSWKFTVATIGSKCSREEQNEMRSNFSYLPFSGSVIMDGPDEEYVLIKEVELDECGSPLFPRLDHAGKLISENDARPPLAVYFGRVLGGGRNLRDRLLKYNLKGRAYLGPTSMDNELSMIMTNLAQVLKHYSFDIQNYFCTPFFCQCCQPNLSIIPFVSF
jgi:tRNA (guanine10-N2)-methyltransferase